MGLGMGLAVGLTNSSLRTKKDSYLDNHGTRSSIICHRAATDTSSGSAGSQSPYVYSLDPSSVDVGMWLQAGCMFICDSHCEEIGKATDGILAL